MSSARRNYPPTSADELTVAALVARLLRQQGIDPGDPVVPQQSTQTVLCFADIGVVVKATRDDYLQQGDAVMLPRLAHAPVSRLAFPTEFVDGWHLLWTEQLHHSGHYDQNAVLGSLHELHEQMRPLLDDESLGDFWPTRHWTSTYQSGLERLNSVNDPAVRSTLERAATRFIKPLLACSFNNETVLHGDTFEDNVIVTDDGIKWIDFGNVRVGPIEFELGLFKNADAYPAPFNERLRQAFGLATFTNIAIWNWTTAQDHPEKLAGAQPDLARVTRMARHGFIAGFDAPTLALD